MFVSRWRMCRFGAHQPLDCKTSTFIHLTLMDSSRKLLHFLHQCIIYHSIVWTTRQTMYRTDWQAKASEGHRVNPNFCCSCPVVPICCINFVSLVLSHWLRRTFKGRASFNCTQNKAPSTLFPLARLLDGKGLIKYIRAELAVQAVSDYLWWVLRPRRGKGHIAVMLTKCWQLSFKDHCVLVSASCVSWVKRRGF